MIAAVNHHMAVRTATVLQHSWLLVNRGIAACGHGQHLTWVEHVRVTSLAKHGLFYNQ
jgi:hypothetical protein